MRRRSCPRRSACSPSRASPWRSRPVVVTAPAGPPTISLLQISRTPSPPPIEALLAAPLLRRDSPADLRRQNRSLRTRRIAIRIPATRPQLRHLLPASQGVRLGRRVSNRSQRLKTNIYAATSKPTPLPRRAGKVVAGKRAAEHDTARLQLGYSRNSPRASRMISQADCRKITAMTAATMMSGHALSSQKTSAAAPITATLLIASLREKSQIARA